MRVIFCSMMFNEIDRNIEKTGQYIPVSGHLYQYALADGLIKNDVDITILNTQRVTRYPIYPQVFFRKTKFYFEGIERGINFKFVNLPIINFFSKSFSLYRELIKAVKRSGEKQIVAVVYNSPLTILIPMLMAKKRMKQLHLCASVGDVPGKYSFSVGFRGFKKFKLACLKYVEGKLLTKFDSFVLVTEQMADALGVCEKPHLVIECLLDTKRDKHENGAIPSAVSDFISEDCYVVFYAGGINFDYGIEHLLKSFSLIEDRRYRLILAGDGNATSLVREYEKEDSRIKALGLITPDEVSSIEMISTVIVNPRLSKNEFVKYSFPSKTYTALASGKPLIAHRLPCYPKEYDRYIQYPDDESDRALKNKIVEICEMPKDKRDEIGAISRDFINNEKNYITLTKGIIAMWNQLLK